MDLGNGSRTVSDSQTAWMILWKHASRESTPGEPFEISDVTATVSKQLNIKDREADHLISGLLTELDRLPDGKHFFRREGNAVVPMPSFKKAIADSVAPLDAYPYEL